MVAKEASIVQYGAGQSSIDSPSPVAALSGSEYRERYACGSASTSAISGASSKEGKANAFSFQQAMQSPSTETFHLLREQEETSLEFFQRLALE
jgi:hypothetical protein